MCFFPGRRGFLIGPDSLFTQQREQPRVAAGVRVGSFLAWMLLTETNTQLVGTFESRSEHARVTKILAVTLTMKRDHGRVSLHSITRDPLYPLHASCVTTPTVLPGLCHGVICCATFTRKGCIS
jgi:hypothetical protein